MCLCAGVCLLVRRVRQEALEASIRVSAALMVYKGLVLGEVEDMDIIVVSDLYAL